MSRRPPFPTALPGLALAALLALPAAAQTQVAPEATHARRPVPAEAVAERFMVAAAHPLAAEAARDVLAEGGTAVDAAIAAQAMLGLVEPQSSGLGGGAFALVWAGGRLTSWDGRETAPAAAGPDYWLTAEGEPMAFADAVPGARSVGVPGVPRLMEAMHQAHGRLPMARLLAPAIAAAREGFAVSPRMAASIASAPGLDAFPAARAYFFAGGAPLAEGARLRNPAYAGSLEALRDAGAEAFYTGPQAQALLEALEGSSNPSPMTAEDLAAYRVVERPAVCVDYRAWEICGMGPPSSGGLSVGQIMGILAHRDLPALGDGPQAWRLTAQASAMAFADRGLYMADADFVEMPQGLLNPDYLAARAQALDADAPPAAPYAPGEPPWDHARLRAPDAQAERPGTTHLSVVDAEGMAVSWTASIETGFGSRLMANGYLLNNELTDFSFRPEQDGAPVANRVEGGKRPRSSMAPTIVLRDGEPALVLGSPGGARIIGYVAGTLVRILDFGMSPAQAVAAGHVANLNGITHLEAGTEAEALAPSLGETRAFDMNSGLHVIAIGPDGRLSGAADPRREGVALGE
ncbi:gamma-glutamyltransferase family protein [Albimonas pacifica]|uniref:Gamma-glutamyltransferase 1 Threonine peptidase. MEROPS family T03 n=1 Tax=Albimonas pacifica TaxID=1114924 RepID=A0A1I3KTC7_9RHOB|nr:gamma-glutamyltransferase family protein [Albimonas pacifica]SFI75365.1 gamma-glutamyltransferase 1 Threonine peptidase. MEROPS family T03 [Albimonas pacifica]